MRCIEAPQNLSDYLPYEAYEDFVFYNRSTLGFGFLGLPIMGFDESAHRQNGKVFVLDVGRSFQKTCLLLGGTIS